MLLQLKDSLETKHHQAFEAQNSSRLQFEQLRSETRAREEKARIETREREERLREDARKRDEESRLKEMEFWKQQRQDELRWRDEARTRDEENRRPQRDLQQALSATPDAAHDRHAGLTSRRHHDPDGDATPGVHRTKAGTGRAVR